MRAGALMANKVGLTCKERGPTKYYLLMRCTALYCTVTTSPASLLFAVQLNKAIELLRAGKPRYRIVMETDI
jgi:hypothetical protein